MKYFILISLTLLTLCKKRETEIKIEKILEIGSNDKDSPYFIGYVRGANIDEQNNIWVLDFKLGKVKVFDKNGNFLFEFGKRGEGPGELSSPCYVDFYKDTVFIKEWLDGIKIFTKKGEYLTTWRTPYGNFVYVNDEGYILTNFQNKNKHCIMLFSKKGEKIDSFGNSKEPPVIIKKLFPNIKYITPRRIFIKNNEVYIVYALMYSIDIYDWRTKRLIKTIKRKIKYPVPKKKRFFPFVSSQIYVGDGNIFYSYMLNSDSTRYYMDVFKENGEFLKTIRTKGALLVVDNEGYFWFSEVKPYQKIVKYRISLKEK